ncbi:MAG: hypothetical protein IAG13_35370, partial [Deltaproteobacteria bacterium]|nr:hypothetical protein [Nannocystaceae bacterium]
MLATSKAMLRPTLSLLVAAAVMIASRPMIAHADMTAPEPAGAAPTQPTTASGEAPISSAEPAPEQPSAPPFEDPQPKPTPSTGAPATNTATPSKPAASKPVPAPKPAATNPDDDILQLPQRLPPMQTAGWWTLFAGFTIGTVAGVLAGLAEREEDAAIRLAARYDLETGSQPAYEDVRTDYENTLRRGEAEASAAIGLAVVGLSAAVAGITVLAV